MGRNIKELHPTLQKKIGGLIAACEKKGLKIRISDCLRTTGEQDALYAQGRTKPGNVVTNAKGTDYSSMHQWGAAFDFYRNDGKGVYYDKDGFFTKVGKIGQSLGLEWGGGWKSMVDKPHFQLPDWGSTATKLKEKYKKPETFFASWKGNAGSTADEKPTIHAKYYPKYTGMCFVKYFSL
ncbi:MAG: M15 family metallopeptidase [Anaerovorax sp.]